MSRFIRVYNTNSGFIQNRVSLGNYFHSEKGGKNKHNDRHTVMSPMVCRFRRGVRTIIRFESWWEVWKTETF